MQSSTYLLGSGWSYPIGSWARLCKSSRAGWSLLLLGLLGESPLLAPCGLSQPFVPRGPLIERLPFLLGELAALDESLLVPAGAGCAKDSGVHVVHYRSSLVSWVA